MRGNGAEERVHLDFTLRKCQKHNKILYFPNIEKRIKIDIFY